MAKVVRQGLLARGSGAQRLIATIEGAKKIQLGGGFSRPAFVPNAEIDLTFSEGKLTLRVRSGISAGSRPAGLWGMNRSPIAFVWPAISIG